MSQTRIHNFSISLDGFGTGEPQSREAPFGHAGERLHEWMFATRFWDASGVVGAATGAGAAGADNAFAERHEPGIGAEIMGANKFGPPGWQDDADWEGWWGPNPPFHTPVFVLTHRPWAGAGRRRAGRDRLIPTPRCHWPGAERPVQGLAASVEIASGSSTVAPPARPATAPWSAVAASASGSIAPTWSESSPFSTS